MIQLPDPFVTGMQEQLGEEYGDFVYALNAAVPVSVRLNPLKPTASFQSAEKIPWATNGRYLPVRPSFTHDPFFQAGCYYVQEASSMLLEQAFFATGLSDETIRAIDLCAAPGGKSTHLLSLMNNESLLISNEIIPNRNAILRQNLSRWGQCNVFVTQNETEHFERLGSYFDLVVVDAPCSGEGLFRKDPDAVNEWSIAAVRNCAQRQEGILKHAHTILKAGGYLIYSTCTYEVAENDRQIETLLGSGEFECVQLPEIRGSVKTDFGLQCYPHKIKGEGFYIALLRKKTGASETETPRIPKISKVNPQLPKIAANLIRNADNYYFHEHESELYAVPGTFINDFFVCSKELYIRQAGIHIGTMKGKDMVPSHQLAQSIHVRDSVMRINVTTENAIRFMRCESIDTAAAENGWQLLCYEGYGLGWIKVMQGRMNNYFPKNLRILS